MEQRNYVLEILVNGKPIKEYPHKGSTYVEGRKSSEYTLRVKNNSSERVAAIITVDGLSVMDGKVGDYNSGGYIVPAFSHIDIPGWRLDNSKVAKFLFAAIDKAYAAQMGKPTNIGVIGCAIFKEKREYPIFSFCDTVLYRKSGPSHEKGVARGIGTGFGDKVEHRVTTVEFDRQSNPDMVMSIYYKDIAGLKAIGVNLKPIAEIVKPNPFPMKETGCTPPPGWNKRVR